VPPTFAPFAPIPFPTPAPSITPSGQPSDVESSVPSWIPSNAPVTAAPTAFEYPVTCTNIQECAPSPSGGILVEFCFSFRDGSTLTACVSRESIKGLLKKGKNNACGLW
jgi:hypothetical protein